MLSASQTDTFLGCKRKWGWNKIAGIQGEPGKGATLGSEVHGQLEAYLSGEDLDYTRESGSGYIAATALEHLPSPVQLRLEREFHIEEDGLHFIGYIDLETDETIYDHKTTSAMSWAKKSEELLYDVQAQIYTRKGYLEGKSEPIRLQWTYMQTKGTRKALPVVCEVPRSHNDAAWAVIKEIGHEIEAVRAKGLDATDKTLYVKSLEPSPSMCEAYGGCPYRGLCNLSVRERTKAFMTTESKPSLMERIEAKKRELAAAVNAPAPVQAAPQINAPPPPPSPQPVETAPAQAPVEAKKPGRPKKTEAAALPAKEGFTLFWGCRPLDAPGVLTFETILIEAQKRILAAHGIADYRFRDFGQGAGLLAQTVAELLDEAKPPVVVVTNSRTPEAGVCFTVLSARASGTVVGT